MMGRLFGRRPDPTPAVRRALRRRFLEPGEDVLAGIYVQRPGTNGAAIAVGTSSATNAAVGIHGADVSSSPGSDEVARGWEADVVRRHGVDPAVAMRTIFLTVALTNSRLLLVRRSTLTRRHPREVFASWPLAEVDHLTVPRGGSTLRIGRGGAELEVELPRHLKFLADVHRHLPDLLEQARADTRPT